MGSSIFTQDKCHVDNGYDHMLYVELFIAYGVSKLNSSCYSCC